MGLAKWVWILFLILIVLPPLFFVISSLSDGREDPWSNVVTKRTHLDHSSFFKDTKISPREITKRCLECHKNSATTLMKTAHWSWLGRPSKVNDRSELIKIGKRNLLNNFCLSIEGNWASCTKCHAGYGWENSKFDFKNQNNVDCLVCHDRTGTYAKGNAGMPRKGIDLINVAKHVGTPARDNCGLCHNYGGGGLAVKHGDLDDTLINPRESDDVHMGKHKLICIDCHKTEKHLVKGKSIAVSVDHRDGINCSDCHNNAPHRNSRLNDHTKAIACQTCHIPKYAKRVPTKMDWDWSKAGDMKRKDDVHHYLRIKGEFKYKSNVVPEYYWFNLNAERYLKGDKISLNGVTNINLPKGNIRDKKAKIWPFKVHTGNQPYDKKFNYLLAPTTAGKGGFWHEFDWDKALRLGEKHSGLKYSGSYGFTKTKMYWPLSHMVAPKAKSLKCSECHGANAKRFNWKELGYPGDPMVTGGRK